jgi:hypothetical protein
MPNKKNPPPETAKSSYRKNASARARNRNNRGRNRRHLAGVEDDRRARDPLAHARERLVEPVHPPRALLARSRRRVTA